MSSNTTLLTNIVSVDPIYFYFDIDERSLLAYTRLLQPGGEKPGTDVMVALSDEEEPSLRGKLDFLSNRLDPGTGTLRARAVLPNPGGLLKAGMFGRIRIPASPSYKGVLIPDVAVMTDQNRRFVWVVDEGGVARAQVVRPGPHIDGYRLIRSGLKGDELIVINGMIRVRPGLKLAAKVVELPPKAAGPGSASAAPAPDAAKSGPKAPGAGKAPDAGAPANKAPDNKTPEKK